MRRPKINTEYLGLLAALLVGTLSVNSMPLLVGGVIAGLQLNPANAGLLASMELGAVAATTLYLSRNLCAFDFRALGWWGASLAFMGNSSCWLTLSEFIPQTSFASLNGQQLDGKVSVLMMGRLVAGVGAGAALAAFSGAIAGLTDPDRKYAKVLVANVTLIGFVMAVLIPHLERGHSYRGTFTALALADLVAIALMRYLPSRMALSQVHHGQVENKMAGTLLIVSLSVFAIGEGAVWAFVEQVGRNIRFESNGVAMSISSVIGVASIVGVVVGAGAAAVLGLKYGRKSPLLFALLVFGVAGPFLASCTSHGIYVLLIFSFVMAQYFLFPYYMGAAAELDKAGRWAAASTGMYLLGSTFGPAVAGQLIQMTTSFRSLGWMVLATSLVPLLMMWVVFSIQRNRYVHGQ